MSKHLTCCGRPRLVLQKTLYDKSHDSESVERCASCGVNWFHRWHEMMNFDGGADFMTDWYTRLTDEEGRTLAAAEGRPDLAFLGLGKRPAICVDEDGAKEVTGQPEWPWG
jgi:hypothetical protein